MRKLNRKAIFALLSVAVVLQCLVLVSQLATAAYPHYVGEEVSVRTIPRDPRSLFRGNYALLQYEFSQLTAADIELSRGRTLNDIRIGEPVYVTLRRGAEGIHHVIKTSLAQPQALAAGDVMIRGRVASRRLALAESRRVDFGIDAYFAPKERALALEKDLREGGIATLKVTRGGRAVLVDVTAE